jgi:hypothetical protein
MANSALKYFSIGIEKNAERSYKTMFSVLKKTRPDWIPGARVMLSFGNGKKAVRAITKKALSDRHLNTNLGKKTYPIPLEKLRAITMEKSSAYKLNKGQLSDAKKILEAGMEELNRRQMKNATVGQKVVSFLKEYKNPLLTGAAGASTAAIPYFVNKSNARRPQYVLFQVGNKEKD